MLPCRSAKRDLGIALFTDLATLTQLATQANGQHGPEHHGTERRFAIYAARNWWRSEFLDQRLNDAIHSRSLVIITGANQASVVAQTDQD